MLRQSVANDKSADAVLQYGDIEVDEQSKRPLRQLEIRQNDCLVNGGQRVDGLELHDNAPFHQKVDSITALQLDVLVDDRNGFLPLELQAAQSQFPRQAFLVCGFEQSGAEEAMDFNRGANDSVSEFIVRHGSGNLAQGERW